MEYFYLNSAIHPQHLSTNAIDPHGHGFAVLTSTVPATVMFMSGWTIDLLDHLDYYNQLCKELQIQ